LEKFFPVAALIAGVFCWSIVPPDAATVEARKQTTSMLTPHKPFAPRLTLVPSSGSSDSRTADSHLDWSTLMKRAQDGDRQAYRTLLEELEPFVRSIARRCHKQAIDVEDAVQDVLLTIHAIRHTYDPARPFGPWLLAIANRRIIDRLRRETRRKAREIELSVGHETFPEPAANLDSILSAELALADAIERLPPEQREAIKMLKLKEMSLKEAAKASGRSIAALKVATHRAIKNLRQLLNGERP
jgi:RNA polymerase sigma-70 factor, ECF subfamily